MTVADFLPRFKATSTLISDHGRSDLYRPDFCCATIPRIRPNILPSIFKPELEKLHNMGSGSGLAVTFPIRVNCQYQLALRKQTLEVEDLRGSRRCVPRSYTIGLRIWFLADKWFALISYAPAPPSYLRFEGHMVFVERRSNSGLGNMPDYRGERRDSLTRTCCDDHARSNEIRSTFLSHELQSSG